MSRSKETVYLPGLGKLAADMNETGKNFNQQAQEIGIDRSSYSNLMKCRKTSSLATARDIARFHGVPIETLLESDPTKILCNKVSI